MPVNMPLNEKMMVSVIRQEAENVEERCAGYRNRLIETISDILEHERKHRYQATNIQQKVGETCRATGQFLAQTRDEDQDSGEDE